MTSLRDVSLAEAGKHGSLTEYAFFDKVSLNNLYIILSFAITFSVSNQVLTLSPHFISSGAEGAQEFGSI